MTLSECEQEQDAFYAHLWHCCERIGHQRLALLRKEFGTFQVAWNANDSDVIQWARKTFGANRKSWDRLLQMKRTIVPEQEWNRLQKADVKVILQSSKNYPVEFLHLNDPPEIFYQRGVFDPNGIRIAVVGTRNASGYGTFVARRISYELSHAGVHIVSGLARGIDSAAHTGALEAGGTTLAVLGSGVHCIYPSENEGLAKRIIDNGCLLSETLPFSKARPGMFPLRNRLIAALCRGVVVVEAGLRSGTLSTVDAALSIGRDVFAVPGPIYETLSQGTNLLIQQGAKLLTCSADILDEISHLLPGNPAIEDCPPLMHKKSVESQLILQSLAGGPVHVTKLCESLKLRMEQVFFALAELEVAGAVESLPGGFWARRFGK